MIGIFTGALVIAGVLVIGTVLKTADELDRRKDLTAKSEARVLACAVRLLDRGFFRIGSEDYAERNESFGLTTMRNRHVDVSGSTLRRTCAGKKSAAKRASPLTSARRASASADV